MTEFLGFTLSRFLSSCRAYILETNRQLSMVLANKYKAKLSVEWAKQLIKAVAFLHKCGVVHRDLKSENILFPLGARAADVFATEGSVPQIKICDFGLARLGTTEVSTERPSNDRTNFESNSRLNKSNFTSPIGTLHCMAPELLCWTNVYDAYAADMWSLGVDALGRLLATKDGLPPPLEWDFFVSWTDSQKSSANFSEKFLCMETLRLHEIAQVLGRPSEMEINDLCEDKNYRATFRQMLSYVPVLPTIFLGAKKCNNLIGNLVRWSPSDRLTSEECSFRLSCEQYNVIDLHEPLLAKEFAFEFSNNWENNDTLMAEISVETKRWYSITRSSDTFHDAVTARF